MGLGQSDFLDYITKQRQKREKKVNELKVLIKTDIVEGIKPSFIVRLFNKLRYMFSKSYRNSVKFNDFPRTVKVEHDCSWRRAEDNRLPTHSNSTESKFTV